MRGHKFTKGQRILSELERYCIPDYFFVLRKAFLKDTGDEIVIVLFSPITGEREYYFYRSSYLYNALKLILLGDLEDYDC